MALKRQNENYVFKCNEYSRLNNPTLTTNSEVVQLISKLKHTECIYLSGFNFQELSVDLVL